MPETCRIECQQSISDKMSESMSVGEDQSSGLCDHTGWRPLQIAFSCLKKVAELTLVYSRYNYSIHGGYSVVYKSTIVVILWFYGRYHMI